MLLFKYQFYRLSLLGFVMLFSACQKQESKVVETPYVVMEPLSLIQNQNQDQDAINTGISSIGDIALTARIYPKKEIPLSFKASGKIIKHFFTTGKQVQKGQVLAQLDNMEQNIALQQAQANRALQQAQLELAQKDLVRFSGLKQEGFISEAQLQNHETQVSIAQKQVKISQEQQKMQEQLNGNLYLKSPENGVIRDFNVQVGQVVSMGQPIASLVSGKQVWVEVTEQQIKSIKIGDSAHFSLENSSENSTENNIYSLNVVEIGQTADIVNKRFLVKLDFNHADSSNNLLKVGLIGYLKFSLNHIENKLLSTSTSTSTKNINNGIVDSVITVPVITVPATAVLMDNMENGVLWFVNQSANQYVVIPHKVKVLQRIGEYIQIQMLSLSNNPLQNQKKLNIIGFVKMGGHLLKAQQIVRIYQ